MKYEKSGHDVFLRIDPGEPLVRSIVDAAAALSIEQAAIVSGVGMLSGAQLGFFRVENDDYDVTDFPGIFDLSLVCGNVTQFSGKPWAHVHAVFNDERYRTYSGHVIEAHCHITIELFLSVSEVGLARAKLVNCPATRILLKDEHRGD